MLAEQAQCLLQILQQRVHDGLPSSPRSARRVDRPATARVPDE
jgi:hypothetical protein